jgi:hypothetical protein
MASNAYIARGNRDGTPVMKVGKANDIHRRQKQIGVSIDLTIGCLDEAAAFRVESQLRDFVVAQGGIQYYSTIDWFQFDQRVYDLLSEFTHQLNGEPNNNPITMEYEIAQLLNRYHELIANEQRQALIAKLDAANEEINRLREELKEKRARTVELNWEVGGLQALAEYYQEQLSELKAAKAAQ